MIDARAALDAIEAHLVRLGRPASKLLQPGLDRLTVALALGRDTSDLPASLLTLYEWHDGTAVPPTVVLDDLAVAPGFYFLSFTDALSHRRQLIEAGRMAANALPILADGGGDYYLVELAQEGAVRRHRAEESEQPVEYRTLDDMFATWARAYDDEVYHVDGDGFLEVDDDRFDVIARALNPTVDWWR